MNEDRLGKQYKIMTPCGRQAFQGGGSELHCACYFTSFLSHIRYRFGATYEDLWRDFLDLTI